MKILRRYGCWGGNPDDVREDVSRCVVSVSRDRMGSGQCTKPRGHGPDGEYCKLHARKLSEGQRTVHVPDVPKEEPWPEYFKRFERVAKQAGFEVSVLKECSPYATRPAVWDVSMSEVVKLARVTASPGYGTGDIPLDVHEHDSDKPISRKGFVVYPSNPPQPKVRQ